MDSRIRIHTPECHGSATLLLSALDPPRVQDPHIKLKISVADPGSAAFLTLDPGWVKNQQRKEENIYSYYLLVMYTILLRENYTILLRVY